MRHGSRTAERDEPPGRTGAIALNRGAKKRILHVIAHMEKGGAEKQLCLLVEASRHEHIVAVLAGNDRETSAEKVLFSSLNPFHIFRLIYKVIREKNVSIVQVWLPWRVTIPAMLAARARGCYTISCDRRKPRSYGIYIIKDRLKYVNHIASHLIIANYPMHDEGMSLRRTLRFPRKTQVIFNGLANLPRPVTINRTPRKLLFVGRLVEQKRVDALIRAFPTIRERSGIEEISITGDGPQRAELERLATSVDSSRSIIFHGARNDWGARFRPEEYFLVLPSTSEGMSNTLFEAIAHGFLPIVTRSREVESLFEPFAEQPFFFSHTDNEGLATAVAQACELSPEELARRIAGLQKGLAAFSVDKMAARYDAIYDATSLSSHPK